MVPPPTIGETNVEKLNTEQRDLTIDELDAASGGAPYQPLIVVAIAFRVAIESLVHKITR
ncbi:hypothetical protein ABIE49_003375 [Bradyrhizobium sp. OAE829]